MTSQVTHVLCDLGHVLIKANSDLAIEYLINDYKVPEQVARDQLYDNPAHDEFCRGKLSSEEYYAALSKYLQLNSDKGPRLSQKELEQVLDVAILEADQKVVELINKLKAKQIPIAIVTDTHEWQSVSFRARLDFDVLGDHIFESHIVGMMKPDTGFFPYVCEKLKIEGAQALLIDDNPINNQEAAKLGIKAPVYTSPEQIQLILQQEGLL